MGDRVCRPPRSARCGSLVDPYRRQRRTRRRGGKKKYLTIDELLGVGLGEVGLCLQDFVRLTPSEFRAVTEAARDRQERINREDWARARLMACLSMQPHLTKRLRPQELLPFPWEQEGKENAEAPKDLGKEESQRRFERLVKQSSNTF